VGKKMRESKRFQPTKEKQKREKRMYSEQGERGRESAFPSGRGGKRSEEEKGTLSCCMRDCEGARGRPREGHAEQHQRSQVAQLRLIPIARRGGDEKLTMYEHRLVERWGNRRERRQKNRRKRDSPGEMEILCPEKAIVSKPIAREIEFGKGGRKQNVLLVDTEHAVSKALRGFGGNIWGAGQLGSGRKKKGTRKRTKSTEQKHNKVDIKEIGEGGGKGLREVSSSRKRERTDWLRELQI